MSVCAVIMAGGTGSRLWPMSRAGYPKQLLPLLESTTMLQSTFLRLADIPVESSITVCGEEHRFFVAEQLRGIDVQSTIVLEPEGRNTAPTIALAALEKEAEDPVLLVLAADHVVQDQQEFTDAVAAALPLAESGKLVTFGIIPTAPHSGYGYIERGDEIGKGYWVKSFKEKPPAALAQNYLDSGDYYWNSGMFLFKASRYLAELQNHRPILFQLAELRWTQRQGIWTSCGLGISPFWSARPNRLTTQSWKKRKTLWWYQWMQAGAISVPGVLCRN
jgi:mannose-1-phosphate guanylyltransferase